MRDFGFDADFLFLAVLAAAAFGILYGFMPETQQKDPPPRAATVDAGRAPS